MTRTCPFILLLLLLAAARAGAEPHADHGDAATMPHIRTTSDRLRSMIRDGIRSSPAFQALVDRLEASDVVVYVEPERRPVAGLDRRPPFLSAARRVRSPVRRGGVPSP